MRLFLVACAAALVAAAVAWAADVVTATLSTSSTMPVADLSWRYTVAVQNEAGDPLAARVRLHVLRGTRLVGCLKGAAIVPCTRAEAGTSIAFRGSRSGRIVWSARWVGVRLTFRAVVVAGEQTLLLRAPVTVRPPP
jgi:hypothetical protein